MHALDDWKSICVGLYSTLHRGLLQRHGHRDKHESVLYGVALDCHHEHILLPHRYKTHTNYWLEGRDTDWRFMLCGFHGFFYAL